MSLFDVVSNTNNKMDCSHCTVHSNHFKLPKLHGQGAVPATIMFISDTPDYTEAVNKKVCLGSQRILIEDTLIKNNIKFADIFFTYALKCGLRNKEINKKDVDICKSDLEQEIYKVKPKVIITLGKFATYAVLKLDNIKKLRGTIHKDEKFNCMVVPTYHPNQVLKVPDLRVSFERDIANAFSLLQDKKPTDLDYKIAMKQDEFDSVITEALTKTELAVDIETTGLTHYIHKIMGISLSWKDKQGVYIPLRYAYTTEKTPIYTTENVLKLKQLLENSAIKILHNGQFDLKFIRYELDIYVKNFLFDTMLAHHVINENEEHGLKYLGSRYPDLSGWEYELKKYTKKVKNFYELPLEVLGKYACGDTDATFRLYKEFLPEIMTNYKQLFFGTIMPMANLLVDIEFYGVHIDVPYVKQLLDNKKAERTLHENKVYSLVGRVFEINSLPKLGKILFEELSMPVLKKTKTGNAIDEEVISKLITMYSATSKEQQILTNLLKYRELNKTINTYLEPALELKDINDRIHGSFLLHGTKTGRLSSRNPNLQNIPNNDEMRKYFIPSKGNKFVVTDFSQIEIRIVANYCKDKVLIEDFMSSDFHKRTASQLFGIPVEEVTKDQRQFAKTCNFALIYLQSEKSFSEINHISLADAKMYIHKYFSRYPRIREWHEKVKDDVNRKGYVETIFGRRRRLNVFQGMTEFDKEEIYRQAVNSPVQSAASDVCVITALRVSKRLQEAGMTAKIVLLVHDELVFDTPEAEVEQVEKIIFEEVHRPIAGIDVFLDVETKVVDAWF